SIAFQFNNGACPEHECLPADILLVRFVETTPGNLHQLSAGLPTGNVPDSSFELGKFCCLHLMICTRHHLVGKTDNERRELPEATENRLQVQVGQRGRVGAKLVSRGLLRTSAGSRCRLQRLAKEQSRIICRVHQSRCRGGSRFDSDPSERNPRCREAEPLHECADQVERGEEYSRGRDADSRSSCAGYDWKQKHPRKSDSSMNGPSNASRRIKFQKWIT